MCQAQRKRHSISTILGMCKVTGEKVKCDVEQHGTQLQSPKETAGDERG